MFTQGAKAAPTDVFLTGAGDGGAPHVRTFGPDGTPSDFNFYVPGGPGAGVYVAAGDIDGGSDNSQELVTASGNGQVAHLAVSRRSGAVITQVDPFPGSTGGATVAAANVDASDAQEVIVGSGPGIGSMVRAYRLVNDQLEEVFSFSPFGPGFKGGIYIGATNGYIVVGAGPGGGPHVKLYKIRGGVPELFSEWFAYGTFPGGVRVAIGATRIPGELTVVTGAGPGGGPHVRVFDIYGNGLHQLMAYDPAFSGGVFVGVAGYARTVIGAGAGGGPHVRVLKFNDEDFVFEDDVSFFAYGANFRGGVHVAGLEPNELPCATPLPGCLDGSNQTTTSRPTTTVKPTTTTAPGATTTTVAACDTIELPGLGCLGGSGDTTTTTVKPTTTTAAPTTTSSTSTTSTSTTSTSTTSTTVAS